MTDHTGRTEGRGRTVLLLALGIAAAWVMALHLWPFLPALVVSAVAATLAYPLYARGVVRWGHPSVLAGLTTLAVFLLVLVPMVGVGLLIGREAAAGIGWLADRTPELLDDGPAIFLVLEDLAARLGLEPGEMGAMITDQLQLLANVLATRTVAFASGVGGWLLQVGAAVFTLYYMLRDGEALMAAVRWMAPLDDDQTDQLVRRARDVTYATVLGNLLVAAVQGLLGGLAFWAVGIPSAALWGTIMAVMSLIPVIGPPVVWVPGVVYLFASGSLGGAVVLLAFGALVISTVDNVLRTVLVSGRAHLHPLVVFFSVLGGIFLFGAMGVLVGPVVFVLALAVFEMARLALDPPGTPAPPLGGFLLGAMVEPAGDPNEKAGGAEAPPAHR